MAGNDEKACTFAAMILKDDDIEVTPDSLKAVIQAAGVTVEPFYPTLFSKFVARSDFNTLLDAGSAAGGGGAAAGGAAPAAGGDAGAGEAKKEEKKEEEEEDDDMGFGLFD
eukprot:NODE_2714_length_515_cov_79.850515_g2664_i0.p1 GENE.NODE_2714_length_515_cov_79.850515_g2664_i0~~NODE_2714_length_515_cov_79.850515_g2664_i0.p1  ORF type:complete len:111 (+),score=45.76 NODE_2714_length_515_cov_79.850515_g2664_i0:80-412(+)